jgi:hypothetical protein
MISTWLFTIFLNKNKFPLRKQYFFLKFKLQAGKKNNLLNLLRLSKSVI